MLKFGVSFSLKISLFIFLFATRSWAGNEVTFNPRCVYDVFAHLHSQPAMADEAAERLLNKIRRGPPATVEQCEALIMEALELPDLPKGSRAEKYLEEIETKVHDWQTTNFRKSAPTYLVSYFLRTAINLRLLVSGSELSAPNAENALGLLVTGENYLPEGGSMSMWRHRAVASLIALGENRDLLEEGLGFPTPTYMSKHHPDLHIGFDQDIKNHKDPSASKLAFGRSAQTQTLKAWALNPDAASHRSAIKQLISLGLSYAEQMGSIRHSGIGVPGTNFQNKFSPSQNHLDGVTLADTCPRPLLEGLVGYLNDDIFPASRRDPVIENRIRMLLPRLGVKNLSGEPEPLERTKYILNPPF